jgi:hypothetical protein
MENYYDSQPFRSFQSAESMEEALRELFESAEPIPDDADLFDVENKLALLNLMATAPADDKPVYLWVRGFPEGQRCWHAEWLAKSSIVRAWSDALGVEVRWLPPDPNRPGEWLIQVKGFHARPLALTEVGTHLFLPKHGGPEPIRVAVVDSLPPQLADSFAFGPIVRVYPEGRPIMDVRTGLVCSHSAESDDFADIVRTFTLAALPRATM